MGNKVSAQGPVLSSTPPPLTPVVEHQAVQLLNLSPDNSYDEWKERCTVITRQDHDEYVKFASEVVADLVDSLPISIEENLIKLDSSILTSPPTTVCISEKHDTHSVCSSADYTPSDSSFDTAREDLQQSLPDLVLLPEGLSGNSEYRRSGGGETEKSDTDYESATDIDESGLANLDPFAASSPRTNDPFGSLSFLENDRGGCEFDKDFKTPVSSLGDIGKKSELVNYLADDYLVPFDREKTPVVSNGVLCYSVRNAVAEKEAETDLCKISSEEFDNRLDLEDDLAQAQIEVQPELKPDCLQVLESPVTESPSSDIFDSSSELVSCANSVGDSEANACESKKDDHCQEELSVPSKSLENFSENQEEIIVELQENTVNSTVVENCPQEATETDSELSNDKSAEVLNVDLEIKGAVEESVDLEAKSGVEESIDLEEKSAVEDSVDSEEKSVVEEPVKPLGASVEQNLEDSLSDSTTSGCLKEIPPSTEDETDSRSTKEVDGFALDERLELEASIIAEELINLSLRENECEGTGEEEPGDKSENMRDVKMADVENNEHAQDESPMGDGGKIDENVNPFQTKSKLNTSPVRGEKLKNGEVSTPTKATDSKKPSTVRRPSPGSRGGLTNASPKRKGSVGDSADSDKNQKAKELANGTSKESHESDDIDTQGFKKPLPKQHPTLPRPGGNKTQPAAAADSPQVSEENSAVSAAMVRSLEDEVITEAGPDVAEFSDGEFRSATDVFKDPAAFDFLQMAGSKHLSESALARMSLYVKFDPLLKAISPVSKKTPNKTPTSDSSQLSSVSEGNDLLLLDTPKDKENAHSPECDNSTPSNKNKVMEARLLDLSPSPFRRQLQDSETNGAAGRRVYAEEELTQALRMQELLFQEQLLKKDREWDDKEKLLEKEKVETSKIVHSLQDTNSEMRKTVLEYEKTISQLIDDREKEKQMTAENFSQMRKERDQALDDLQSVESAFADLHRRYEKSKTAVEGFKKNEDILKSYVKESQLATKKQEQKYDLLKQHAEETLERANLEIDSLRRSSEAENAALRAQLKKAEMKVDGLEKSLKQKNKENAELTNLCDELIAKVGQANS